MKIIGLTGGIGSGKTTVAQMFEKLGASLFIADLEAKKLLDNDQEVMAKVKRLLGEQAYCSTAEGNVLADRQYIASQVFQDKTLLDQLNAIVHPALRQYFDVWKHKVTGKYIIYEAAILLETGGRQLCDQVILISAPLETRIQRVISRDEVTRAEVERRLASQWTDLQRLQLADFVIMNEDLQQTKRIVSEIHELLLN
ncbi:dephospho-CoA kinase [Nonlabens xiamenensis]|uniref:dephospho-CoA kinase n=1 Tax=Nonlabens xiamenensis TaxID=2341043 RepID=UPI000F606EAC|nr:dephospho-CoA kinase [Nonlabens xiamenensis]